jgi:hypothetical protein
MSSEDTRFVRDGRALRDWLLELLGPDRATRRLAENAISAMWWGAPVADASVYQYLPADVEAHGQAWGNAISEILADPEFPGRKFIESAIAVMLEDSRKADELLELEDNWFDRSLDDDPSLESEAQNQILDKIKAGHVDENEGKLSNSFGTRTLHRVLEHAGPILLTMPETVRGALRDRALSATIAKALEHSGPAAAAFGPDLLQSLEPDPETGRPESPFTSALASVARNDATVVRQLLNRPSRRIHRRPTAPQKP